MIVAGRMRGSGILINVRARRTAKGHDSAVVRYIGNR